jgi:hypothetical protein
MKVKVLALLTTAFLLIMYALVYLISISGGGITVIR